MSVKIRLKRIGAKKNPFYRIVVADSRNARDGKVIDEIGSYNPKTVDNSILVDKDKAAKWIQNGAQPTDTVRGLFKIAGIIKEQSAEVVSEPGE